MATITVTNENDSGAGSLRAALAAAAPGDVINFATDVTTINLNSSLVINKGITIDGLQPGSTNPDVTINGGGAGSNFSDFVIDAGVTATFDGLIIQDGHATGAAGANTPLSYLSQPGGHGSAAAGGIYDAGALTLNNSVLQADTATGGFGGRGAAYGGGGGGGSAAGAIYVGATGSLDLNPSDSFINDSAAGGVGGGGGGAVGYASGVGGAGGVTGVDAGSGAPGTTGSGSFAGAGGAPGQPGASGRYIAGPGGGGGGGNAFVVGGKGSIAGAATLVVTNNSDNATTAGSLRFELAIAHAGDTILFDPSVTTIDLSSSLVIAANLTIDGLRAGSTTPGVTINGGGNSSNFADFTVNAGVSATIDGLIIQDGHATGAAGANGAAGYDAGGNGGAAAGGIYDAGALTLDNSVLQADTATGGSGGFGGPYGGGGGGGSAAGAIYVAKSGSLDLASSDTFISDSAVGGDGGKGGNAVGAFALFYAPGTGGAGGVTGFNTGYGAPGAAATGAYGGRGGALGQPGSPSRLYDLGAGGGGGGGSAFIVGGAGTVSAGFDVVTNESDNVNTVGSLRYELAHANAGDTISFEPWVTTIDLASTLAIAKNVTIEGAQPGSTTPAVTVDGGGSSSNFTDFTINAGVSATLDGLVIADGHATGRTGAASDSAFATGGNGSAAAGGVYVYGNLTLTNSVLQSDTATGGTGGAGNGVGDGGGAGGNAAGAVYVARGGGLTLASSDSFRNDSAVGGAGGQGGHGFNAAIYTSYSGGAGGAGGVSGTNGGFGAAGATGGGSRSYAGAGGAPGRPGALAQLGGNIAGAGGGGGGGNAFADISGAGSINGPVPCYCRGTMIETKRGEKKVETLAIGDKVVTASGALRPVKWIGRRSYAGRFVLGRKDILPVCIKAGALGTNMPVRDLWISPHHAMYFSDQGGVLIEAKDLVNGISIVQAERVDKVEYVHVELETHDVIIAEGALSETYLDEDNRGMFHNALDYDTLYTGDGAQLPTRYCAPRLEDGYAVEDVRRRIAARVRTGSRSRNVKVHRRAARR